MCYWFDLKTKISRKFSACGRPKFLAPPAPLKKALVPSCSPEAPRGGEGDLLCSQGVPPSFSCRPSIFTVAHPWVLYEGNPMWYLVQCIILFCLKHNGRIREQIFQEPCKQLEFVDLPRPYELGHLLWIISQPSSILSSKTTWIEGYITIKAERLNSTYKKSFFCLTEGGN